MSVIVKDGAISINGHLLKIPNVKCLKIIGTGANGCVFFAKHKFLDRDVAVKVWLKQKTKDSRDKFRQGIEEAKKADTLKHEDIVKVFDAGECSGYFYCVMEFFKGRTLKDWLIESQPQLYPKFTVGRRIFDIIWTLEARGLHHGDLHWKNILVSDDSQLKILDFGTSHFISNDKFLARHWNVVFETLNRLFKPFNILKMHNMNMSLEDYIESGLCSHVIQYFIQRWYAYLHYAINYTDSNVFISQITNKNLINIDEREKTLVEELVKSKQLVISNDTIGYYSPWGSDDELLPII